MNFRSLIVILAAAGAAAGCVKRPAVIPNAQTTETFRTVDRVVVHKAERRLLLIHGTEVVRSYRIELGLNPVGQKERSGDSRTPEGTYYLVRRNLHSDYFLSLQVSYPNPADIDRARAHHWDAGGMIMIHGMPNRLKRPREYYLSHDWTDGCIALSNADMAEVWKLAPDNVRIDILP